MCINDFTQQRTVANNACVVNSDLSMVPLTNSNCETTIIRRASSVLGITFFTRLSFPHQFLEKLLCTAAILHTRRVSVERSARSMYHLFSYDVVKLRNFIGFGNSALMHLSIVFGRIFSPRQIKI